MSVKFKKLAIASAVGATLGMAGVAQADNHLLFPYVTTGATSFTFVTMFQDPDNNLLGNGLTGFPVGVPPHDAISYNMYYGYKGLTSAATDPCNHRDFSIGITQGALLQFEVGNQFDLPFDFGDPAGYGENLRKAANVLPMNNHGFLIVETTDPTAAAASPVRTHGEAVVVDTASGLALSYTAVPTADGATVPSNYGAAVPTTEYVTSWMPQSLINTSWYVLPTDVRNLMTPNMAGGLRAMVYAVTNPNNPGAFARAEDYASGVQQVNLRCFATVGLDQLFEAGKFGMGGWASVAAATQNDQWSSLPVYADVNVAASQSGNRSFALWKLQASGELGNGTVTVFHPAEARLPQ